MWNKYKEQSQLQRFSIYLPRWFALPWLSTPRTTWFVLPRTSEKTLWQRSLGPCYSGNRSLNFSFSWTCPLCWRETFCPQDPERLPHCLQWRNLGHRQLLVEVSMCYNRQISLQISKMQKFIREKSCCHLTSALTGSRWTFWTQLCKCLKSKQRNNKSQS